MSKITSIIAKAKLRSIVCCFFFHFVWDRHSVIYQASEAVIIRQVLKSYLINIRALRRIYTSHQEMPIHFFFYSKSAFLVVVVVFVQNTISARFLNQKLLFFSFLHTLMCREFCYRQTIFFSACVQRRHRHRLWKSKLEPIFFFRFVDELLAIYQLITLIKHAILHEMSNNLYHFLCAILSARTFFFCFVFPFENSVYAPCWASANWNMTQ